MLSTWVLALSTAWHPIYTGRGSATLLSKDSTVAALPSTVLLQVVDAWSLAHDLMHLCLFAILLHAHWLAEALRGHLLLASIMTAVCTSLEFIMLARTVCTRCRVKQVDASHSEIASPVILNPLVSARVEQLHALVVSDMSHAVRGVQAITPESEMSPVPPMYVSARSIRAPAFPPHFPGPGQAYAEVTEVARQAASAAAVRQGVVALLSALVDEDGSSSDGQRPSSDGAPESSQDQDPQAGDM
jgi:hypothetical protein